MASTGCIRTCDERPLDETPTWAVAMVCFVLVVISLFIEQLIHHLGEVNIHLPFIFLYMFESQNYMLPFDDLCLYKSMLLSVRKTQIFRWRGTKMF